jgi:cell division initiation protein
MSYTPVELRHVHISRSLFGYNRVVVEQMIEEIADSFEATWRERGALADRIETLEKELAELRQREDLLTHTLVAAEQVASDVREQARRAAEAIVSEAQQEARQILRTAQTQRETLGIESRRIEGMLRAALVMVEEGAEPASLEVVAGSLSVAAQPPAAVSTALEDTQIHPAVTAAAHPADEDSGEFRPVALPPAPEGEPDRSEAPSATPFLRRLASGTSRDFDWGD